MATATATIQVELTADPRETTGKGPAGRLRREGRVPGVVYGHDVASQPVSVDALELYHALKTEAGSNVLIRLQLNGDEHLAFAREVQRHPVRDDVLHVDLFAVDPETKLSVEVPVRLVDQDSARDSGGVVNLVLHTVPLEISPLQVPQFLELSVADMEIGDNRRVADIPLPEGAELDIEPDRTVVTINAPDVLEEPEEEPADLAALEDLTEEELAALEELEAERLEEGEEGDEGVPAAAAGPGAAVGALPEEEDETD